MESHPIARLSWNNALFFCTIWILLYLVSKQGSFKFRFNQQVMLHVTYILKGLLSLLLSWTESWVVFCPRALASTTNYKSTRSHRCNFSNTLSPPQISSFHPNHCSLTHQGLLSWVLFCASERLAVPRKGWWQIVHSPQTQEVKFGGK